jgi:hypothetical protein
MPPKQSQPVKNTPQTQQPQPAKQTPTTKSTQQVKTSKPQPAKPAKPLVPTEQTYAGLRRFNGIMGFLHLLQGILILVLSNATTYPIYTNFLKFDAATQTLQPNPTQVYALRFGPAVALFLLLSAAAHFSLATFAYPWYEKSLKKGMNPARFYEYALSSSLMIVLIGMLVGVYDLGALILMFGINAMMNLFGIMMELHNQTTKKTNWTSYIYGCIAGIVPWIVIVMYFLGSLASSDAKPPAFVYAIIPTIFVFFNIFAVNMVLQYKKVGRWRDYLFGERVYIILSLTAKTALAWMVFAGTLAPV